MKQSMRTREHTAQAHWKLHAHTKTRRYRTLTSITFNLPAQMILCHDHVKCLALDVPRLFLHLMERQLIIRKAGMKFNKKPLFTSWYVTQCLSDHMWMCLTFPLLISNSLDSIYLSKVSLHQWSSLSKRPWCLSKVQPGAAFPLPKILKKQPRTPEGNSSLSENR